MEVVFNEESVNGKTAHKTNFAIQVNQCGNRSCDMLQSPVFLLVIYPLKRDEMVDTLTAITFSKDIAYG